MLRRSKRSKSKICDAALTGQFFQSSRHCHRLDELDGDLSRARSTSFLFMCASATFSRKACFLLRGLVWSSGDVSSSSISVRQRVFGVNAILALSYSFMES